MFAKKLFVSISFFAVSFLVCSCEQSLSPVAEKDNGKIVAGITPAGTAVQQGWSLTSYTSNSGIASYDDIKIGDFDGDGADEILGWNYNQNKYLYEFNGSSWVRASYKNSDILKTYLARKAYVGDFNGDGKDELFLARIDLRLVEYTSTGWKTIKSWSDSHAIYPYKDFLLVGDWDGNGRDDLMGCGDNWQTSFYYDPTKKEWGWWYSNYGENQGITPYLKKKYRTKAAVGDFDNDGKDEIFGIASWATMFHYGSGSWQWGWSTGNDGINTNKLCRWYLPLAATANDNDIVVSGDFGSNLNDDEFMIIESGQNARNYCLYDFKSNGIPYIYDTNDIYEVEPGQEWPVKDNSIECYFKIKPIAGEKDQLLVRKNYSGNRYVSTYRHN